MNNPANQPGSSMPGDENRGQNPSTSTGSAGGTSSAGGARKTGAAAGQARGASSQSATASTDRESGDQSNMTSSNQNEGADQQSNKTLDTAIESGKKWIEDSGVLNSVNDLPQTVKEWGSRAASRVGELTTTQKIVGGALLAVGIGYLATRKNDGKENKSQSRFGRQSGSNYGRSSGYQAPDASNSRRTSVGSGRSDSGAAYRSTGSGFGSTTPGSDASARTSESSYRSPNADFRSIE